MRPRRSRPMGTGLPPAQVIRAGHLDTVRLASLLSARLQRRCLVGETTGAVTLLLMPEAGLTRILALTLYYPPHSFGGYERSCRDVMTRLATRGHEVSVLTSDLRLAGVEESDDPRVAVRRELGTWLRADALYRPSLRSRLAIERSNHRALDAMLREHRPEVVTVWHMGAMSLGLLERLARNKMPLVYVIGDDWLCYAPELDSWGRLFRKIGPFAGLIEPLVGVPTRLHNLGHSAILFNSRDNQRRAHAGSRWHFEHEAVIYVGLDKAVFTPGVSRERDWGRRLLFAGRFDPRKGLATVIEALPALDEHVLEVRGTGGAEERERLRAMAHELGVADRVWFADPLAPAALAERYRQADAVVFPSIWEEPFGLVPVEAMACGTPVVATGTGGSGEFLLGGINCVRFTAGNAQSLVAAVRRLAGDVKLRRALVESGLRTAAYFDVERLTDAVADWVAAAKRGFSGPLPRSRRFEATVATAATETEC